MQSSSFNAVLESIEALPTEEQEILLDLIQRRLIERRRTEIADNISQSTQEHQSGQVFRGTVDELMAELKD
jgi:hypothetical protein